MRYCIHCKEPMHTSMESIWIGNNNYDIHKKCKTLIHKWERKVYKGNEKGDGEE